jgi:dihydroflavonol-4-reductase
METSNQTVLVTGATGMLGVALMTRLLASGNQVKALYRSELSKTKFAQTWSYYSALPFNSIEWVEADLLDYPTLLETLEGVDVVYHVAAMVSFHSADKSALYHNNVNGTANVVNACLDNHVKKLCHVSSVAALGSVDDDSEIDERTAWIPEQKHSGYSISKFHSEMEVWRGMNEGLEVVVLNPSVIIGPGDWTSGSPAFFSTLAKGLRFYPAGTTGFVDVRDVADAMIQLTDDANWSKTQGQRFLLNAENQSYQSFFSLIAQALQVEAPGVKVNKWMIAFTWRMAYLIAKLTRKKALITREALESSYRTTRYNGRKIEQTLPFKYRPLAETVVFVAACFKKAN